MASLEGVLSKKTLNSFREMGFSQLTDIQSLMIPKLFDKRDAVIRTKPGSGKILGYIILTLEMLFKLKTVKEFGPKVLILSPTRELAIQIFSLLKKMNEHHTSTCSLIMGGKRNTKDATLQNIIVATPGRLLNKLRKNETVIKHLNLLIIDEVSTYFEVGLEKDLKQIICMLDTIDQKVLFTSSLNEKCIEFIKVHLIKLPLFIGMEESEDEATMEGLQQGYLIVQSEKRFLLLFHFLKTKRKNHKVVVFFNSCKSVQFYHDIFNSIYLYCNCIHGQQQHTKRADNFRRFSEAETGILLCTDVVASRGLEIPNVDWVLQYDPPENPKAYLDRVGRTTSALKKEAMILLRPEELKFLSYLKQACINVNVYRDFPWEKTDGIQIKFQNILERSPILKSKASAAFTTHIQAYKTQQLKDCFSMSNLDFAKEAKAFGLTIPPRMKF